MTHFHTPSAHEGEPRDQSTTPLTETTDPRLPELKPTSGSRETRATQEAKSVQRAEELLGIPDIASLDALLELLETVEMPVQIAIIRALSNFDHPRAIASILRRLTHPNAYLASIAFSALESRAALYTEEFCQALPDCTLILQMQIVALLGRSGAVASVPTLMGLLLTTPSSSLRYTLIQALGNLGSAQTPGLISLIRTFQNDADHHVQTHARRVLTRLEQEHTAGAS